MRHILTLALAAIAAIAPHHAAAQTAPTVPASIDDVFAPVRVATAPSDAYIGLALMPDGEVRHYNYGEQAAAGSFYLSSRDHGLTWTRVKTVHDVPQADTRSPISGEYLRLAYGGGSSTVCIRTRGGVDGDRTVTRVSDLPSIMLKPPVFVRGGRRVVVCGHGGVDPKGCYCYISDDDGLSWRRSQTVTVPPHRGGGFHQGIRWNHGAVEPTVTELADGRLWMLIRTAQDYHYEAFSDDGGETWSEARPSRFYGTITMPTFHRLADGRLLLFWCSTTPLPELPTANGVWDDVFTNRDVTHVAISSDDGKTWTGCRELYLNPLRDAADFGTMGGGIDKSVHQAQCVEVAPGKICVALGQHEVLRSIVLFDVEWLNEAERADDFSHGLADWTTFCYRRGIVGHCAYNRVAGCRLEPHSADAGRSMLRVCYERDTTLVCDSRGAVWNFPTLHRGSLDVGISIPRGQQRVRLLLNDHWYNPSDSVARTDCMYDLALDRRQLGIGDDGFHTLSLTWDLEAAKAADRCAVVTVDGRRRVRLPLLKEAPLGISYVHFLALPCEEGAPGVCIDRVASRQPRRVK